jgi:hypothetical protein
LVVLAAICALVLLWGLLPVATAAAQTRDGHGHGKVVLFEDFTIHPADVWTTVVVVGGDVVIAGTIQDTIVVVGGDVYVESTATIGGASWTGSDRNAVVAVLGHVTIEPGAEIRGDIVDVLSDLPGALRDAVVEPVLHPWRVGTPLGLVWGFVAFVAVTLLVAAVAPGQLAFVRDRVRGHFFSSLGWGILGTFVGIPLSIVVLIVTVVGILALAPWLAVVLPLMFLFGSVAMASWIGSAITRTWSDRRASLLPVTALGAVILSLVWFVPGLGSLVAFVVCMVGFGATITAFWEWRGQVRRREREAAAQRGAAAPATWAGASHGRAFGAAASPPAPAPGPAAPGFGPAPSKSPVSKPANGQTHETEPNGDRPPAG